MGSTWCPRRLRCGPTGVGGAGGSCYDPGGAQEFEKVAEVEAAGERDELGVARPHGDDEGPQESGGDEPGADVRPDFPCPEHAAGGQRADAWNGAAVRGACLGRIGTEQPGG